MWPWGAGCTLLVCGFFCGGIVTAQTSATLHARGAEEHDISFTGTGPLPMIVRLDGEALPKEKVHTAPATPRLMFLLDAINSSQGDLLQSQRMLSAFLRSAGGALPAEAEIWIVSDVEPRFRQARAPGSATMALDKRSLWVFRTTPGYDGAALAAEVESYMPLLPRFQMLPGGAAEQQRLSLEALSFILQVQSNPLGSRLLLYLSPGWPAVHSTSAGDNQQVFDFVVYFSDLLRNSGVVLSQMAFPALGINQAREQYRDYLKPPRTAREANLNDLLLPVLVHQSGGTVSWYSNDFGPGLKQFLALANEVFTIRFAAPPAGGGLRFHTVETMAHTSTGFYGR